MARTSLTAAKAELFALLHAGSQRSTVAGIAAVYDYDPAPGRAVGPIAMTVTSAGIGADDWRFAIRLLADAGADPAAIHRSLDLLMPAVSAKVTDRFGDENWVGPTPHPDRADVLVCEWIIECGRED